MSTPVVSVVIPTHNRADLLGGAIESVLRQRGEPVDAPDAVDLIVVDDASTDGTRDVLARYDKAVRVIRNEQRRERGASRNLGAEAARGKWVAFLDSDDEWEEGKLASQLTAIGPAKACLTGCWLIDRQGGLVGLDDRPRRNPSVDVTVANPYRAVPSSLLIHRELYRRIGGFPEDPLVQGSEDWLLMVQLVKEEGAPVVVQDPLVRYRVHLGQSTADPSSYMATGLAAVDWLEREGIVVGASAAAARAQKYEAAARAYALDRRGAQALQCPRRAAAAAPPRQRLSLVRDNAWLALKRCVG